MDQRASDIRRDIEGAHAVMTEKIGMVEERAQETMEGVKSTVDQAIDQAMEGFKQIQETVEGTKSAVDTIIESVKLTVDETIERVKTTADLADLIDQVQQHPWLMLGSAILLGYILGGLAKGTSSAFGQMPERPRPDHASAHDGHEPSEVH